MRVTINGAERELAAQATILDLLKLLETDPSMVAVARNGEFVVRSRYASELVRDQDQIEVVNAAAGG